MDRVTYIPQTFYQMVYNTVTNQDFQQKTNMVVSVSLELYRVMVSSLLLLVIPQACGVNTCSLEENLARTDTQYKIGFIINYITVVAFILLYATEIRREEKLIKLLEVNPTISTDNTSVGQRIEIFEEYKKNQLYQVDQYYKYSSYLIMCIFIINTIYSWRIIYTHSIGNQTLLNFVTNILFMISKLSNVLVIITTDKHVFFSAYLNTKVQFNDIDPREIAKIQQRHRRTILTDDNIVENPEKEFTIKLLEEGGFELI